MPRKPDRPPKTETFAEWMARVDREVEAEYQAVLHPPADQKAPRKSRKKAPKKAPVPHWFVENPGGNDMFELTMYDEDGMSIAGQTIKLSAREFIALKFRLAILRGLITDSERRPNE